MKTLPSLFLSTLLLIGCGGDVFTGGDGGDGGGQDAQNSDGEGPDSGQSFTCGSSVCSGADAVCVHPCCGGALFCGPLDDAGVCPPGEQPSNICQAATPCTCAPPPPFCGTKNQCGMVQGHDCYEVCA
jgi:hypothetical protein